MIKPDWVTAPNGATHYVCASISNKSFWAKCVDGSWHSWLEDGGTEWIDDLELGGDGDCFVTPDKFIGMHDIPPIGSTVDVMLSRSGGDEEWIRTKVVGHDDGFVIVPICLGKNKHYFTIHPDLVRKDW